MTRLRGRLGSLALLFVFTLFGCSTSTVRTVSTAPLIAGDGQVPEDLLLDVGVRLFDPGVEKLKEDDILTAPEIRQAESRYLPTLLVDALARSGNWGAVRVMPEGTGISDVTVNGRILESTGESLVLEITPSDASGATWYTRKYEAHASKYSYDRVPAAGNDAFQDIYNRIANDMAVYRARFDDKQAKRLRQISEMRFAEGFSPEAFGGYLKKDTAGRYDVVRLPADNDPMMQRIHRIRERDQLFVDTLQEYYGGFAGQMRGPYHDWRKETYTEALQYKEMKQQATTRTLVGIAAVVGGLLAATTGDSQTTRVAGAAGVIGGASMIKSGMGKRNEAKLHAETLKELGGSLSADINPQVIELDDRSVTLTGTVQDQYGKWREILHGIYESEAGSI